ncbi:MAG: cellulase family glycosylhydrolase [Chloroflexi bacterium]|nr:cellulase family glycosylhydrolase [Chloroflexota bacterium]
MLRGLSLLLVLAVLAVLAASVSPAAPLPALAAPAASVSGLHVAGNQILNGSGQVVRLRGVNRTSGEYACIQGWGIFEGPTSDAAIQAMLSWKINVVRIPLNEDCWLDVNTGGIDRQYVGASYRTAVTDYVSRLTAAGIAAILDLHWAAPGAQRATGQTPMANRDHSVAFWTSVASTFKTNTAVIFDLFNEPYPDNNTDTVAAWTCLRDGTNGSGACPGVGYSAAGMQELLDAVRATGATNLVMVAGVAYTGVLSRWMTYKPVDSLNPPNIAASVHIYPGGSQCSTVTCWDQQLAPIAAQYPIIAGEIGQSTCAHDRLDTVIDWFEAKGQHYLAWVWWTEPCGSSPYYGLITDHLTGAPSVGYGQGYKDRLAALVGAPAPTPTATPPGVPTATATRTPTATPTRTASPTPTAVSGATPTRTATPGGTPTAPYVTSAAVSPSSVTPGGGVSIGANVTIAAAGVYVVDVEVHNATEQNLRQWYWENQSFAAGQTRSYPVTWSVPANMPAGTYTVQIGVFSADWGVNHFWDSYSAFITVGAATPTPTATRTLTATATPTRTATPLPPADCTTRPSVTISTRPLGGGQLEATILAHSTAAVPSNGFQQIQFTSIQNGSVRVGSSPVTVGATVALASATSTTLVLTRVQAGQAATAAFAVRDRCGDWHTFVGGGPSAF